MAVLRSEEGDVWVGVKAGNRGMPYFSTASGVIGCVVGNTRGEAVEEKIVKK